MTLTSSRRTAALLTALVALVATFALTASPAHATAYRFWSYWQGASGQWVASQTGAPEHEIVDKDVQGWRFGITTDAPSDPPDNAASFDTLCADLAGGEAPSGQLRVAVVVDAGFAADAPEGQTPPADQVACVTVPEGSNGSQALAAAGTVTENAGMVCAINGYPQGECSATVSDDVAAAAASAAATESPNPATTTASSESDSSSGSPWALIAALAALVAVAGTALIVNRRRTAAIAEPRPLDGPNGDGDAGTDLPDRRPEA